MINYSLTSINLVEVPDTIIGNVYYSNYFNKSYTGLWISEFYYYFYISDTNVYLLYYFYNNSSLYQYTFESEQDVRSINMTNVLQVVNYTYTGSLPINDISCYDISTYILTLQNSIESYRQINTLKPGDLVKVYPEGYKRIELIGYKKVINHPIYIQTMYIMEKSETNNLTRFNCYRFTLCTFL